MNRAFKKDQIKKLNKHLALKAWRAKIKKVFESMQYNDKKGV